MGGYVLRIGILDNDPCALELITTIVREACASVRLQVDVAATIFPTALLRMCADPDLPLDAVLLDISLNGTSGVDLAARLRSRVHGALIVGMTAYETSLYRHHVDEGIFDALLDKATLRTELPRLLPSMGASVQIGKSKSQDVGCDLRSRRLSLLTNKELELLTMSADGLPTPVIARRLGIRESTVFHTGATSNTNWRLMTGMTCWMSSVAGVLTMDGPAAVVTGGTGNE